MSLQRYICSREDILNYATKLLKAELPLSFRLLERLLIVHGHWCYKRITQMVTFTLCRVIKRNDLGQRTIYLQGESKSKRSISFSMDDLTPRFSTDVLRTSEESASQARTILNGSNDSTLISSSSEVSSGIELQLTMTEIDQTSPLFSSYLASDTLKLMSDGEILHAASFHESLDTSREFQDLVNAHKGTVGSERLAEVVSPLRCETAKREIKKASTVKQQKTDNAPAVDQLIKEEERETGDTGLKPYLQYLNQSKGYLYFSLAGLCHLMFVSGQITQNSWMAANKSHKLRKKMPLLLYLNRSL
ncbi:uncharacterized protein LOC131253162 isoform X2 [Magnolia sinica]|uniref:uncharacterized protein LOC131253162 isoform X2 n=1 Tax=Magnolia sinica TaxID=86752 RepID=UPI00265B1D6A|nr:uncharacterized protein LOC131253162 isoform X2 [Magnolia sinica]